MNNLKIAVIGAGISGLSAAWLLSKRHNVTLYESQPRLGGHAHTVDTNTNQGTIPVDTGFIVYNEQNYPNLTALFRHLNVDTEYTEMTFALSLDDGSYEYSGTSFRSFFGQASNFFNPLHWLLLKDVTRFFRHCRAQLKHHHEAISLGDFLKQENYSKAFVERHIVPMGAAIWSTSMDDMLKFPAANFINFCANHGMLQINDRPLWRTVTNGSREYVRRLEQNGDFEIQTDNAIERICRRDGFVQICDSQGALRPFDHVIIATHADQALELLDHPTDLERRLLSPFSYQKNKTVLHRDARLMPRRKGLWSSWNYLKTGQGADTHMCVTYWMNRLQQLGPSANLFVTLNPPEEIHPKAVQGIFDYKHPVFNDKTATAQQSLWDLQGRNRTWFCGSYFGYGFHEDGIESGLTVAEQLGQIRRPWAFDQEKSRIFARPVLQYEAAE